MSIAVVNAQQRLFDTVASTKNVTSTFIGSTLIKTMDAQPSIPYLGGSSDFINEISSIEIITCENAGTITAILPKCEQIIENLGMSTIMESKDDEDYRMKLLISLPESNTDEDNGGTIYGNRLIILNYGKKDFILVHVNGKFDLGKLVSSTYKWRM
jgi:hypothetical protein